MTNTPKKTPARSDVRVVVSLPPELAQRFKALAEHDLTSMSAIIRQLILKHMQQIEEERGSMDTTPGGVAVPAFIPVVNADGREGFEGLDELLASPKGRAQLRGWVTGRLADLDSQQRELVELRRLSALGSELNES